jgi:rhomboid protease GluP
MFRWIIDDTRALLRDLRRACESFATRWRWFRIRSRQKLSRTAADLDNVRKSAAVPTRMCRSCRALIPVEARVCPECGDVPGERASRGAARVLENMVPGAMSVSAVLLTTTLIVYGLQMMVWNHLQREFTSAQGGMAWFATSLALGANAPGLVFAGELWRLLSSVFLHGGILHLLFNMWALLTVGPLMEQIYGPRRLLSMYVATGIAASFTSAVWRGGEALGPGVGASGAICGLIGAAAAWGWRRGGRVGEGIKGQMVQWAIYVLVAGFLIGFDNAAHLGGLISGGILGLVMSDGPPRSAAARAAWGGAAWFCGLLIAASFAMVVLHYERTLQLVFRLG